MSVKHDDFVEVKVEITRKQRDWLTTLGEDLRYDLSYAFRLLVDREIEAHEKDPFNPLRYSVRNRFENCVKNQCKDELDEAKKLLPKVVSVWAKAGRKNIIHPSVASRKVSRISKTLHKL